MTRAWTQSAEPLRVRIGAIDAQLLPDRPREQLSRMLANHAQQRLEGANRRSSAEWRQITDRAEWESFRRMRLDALRDSLGRFPSPPGDLHRRVTGTLQGDGFVIENLVFESRPGLWVTANLYRPEPPSESMPGILLSHSHHNPKTQGELQDMGMTWARLGCLVLVIDQLGHGERRQHPFASARDYPDQFPVGRQDYYFRYNTGIQLHLIGDSLMGWMAWDLWRGVDLLLTCRGIDAKRIVLMGSVAGGGDPAAVAAALDERIAVTVPFNFGGPQPETPYPLPEQSEATFNYSGSGSWEPTRNLRLSCRDGFLPWVIVGSLAPRRLIYAHEFSWDRERDPVWRRFQRIYSDFYGAPGALDHTSGFGVLAGQPPEASHCNNIGAPHRAGIHAVLKRWLNIPGGPEREYQNRLPAEELLCLRSQSAGELRLNELQALASQLGQERASRFRAELSRLSPAMRVRHLRAKWQSLLGAVQPGPALVLHAGKSTAGTDEPDVEKVVLETEPGILVPLILLKPAGRQAQFPVVLGLAQAGKTGFLRHRAGVIAEVLMGGAAVCLPDLRGTGETSPGEYRGRTGADTSISSTELMLGETMVGARLRDVRSILRFLRSRPELKARRIALWGDSFAPANPPDRDLRIPFGISQEPALSEPVGGMLAMLTALHEDSVSGVYLRGGLTSFKSVLQSQFCYLPYDAVIPGTLEAGDLCEVAAALSPRLLRLEGLVDGQNRRAPMSAVQSEYEPAREAYARSRSSEHFVLGDPSDDSAVARWLLKSLSEE